MNLSDKVWKELKGGYKIPYDASIPPRKLEQTDDPKIITKIWKELWNELHHQGDVGLASYLSVPQLARIGTEKGLVDWNLIGICCTIEQQRHDSHNPTLPKEFETYYKNGLKELKQLALEYLKRNPGETTLIIALSTIATCNGNIKLGRAIIELEDKDVLNEFLEQF